MLAFDTLLAARDALRSRQISAVELIRQSLDRIQNLDPQIHAFNSTFPDRALEQARDVDNGLRTGPLAGVPIALKDNICTTFGTTTCSSQNARKLPRPLRRHRRPKARSRRRRHPRQDQPRRIRHGLLHRKLRLRPHHKSLGHHPRPRRFLRRQRRRSGRPPGASAASAPTPAAPSASPPPSAASSASNPPTAASPATASSPSPPPSTRSAPSA